MKNVSVPENYNRVMPYLIVKDAPGFIRFMQRVFGAEEIMKVMQEDGRHIMHAELRLGDSVIMLADSNEEFPPQNAGMFIYVADTDAAYAGALEAGAISQIEPQDKEYGRSAGVKDPHGNVWWITQAM